MDGVHEWNVKSIVNRHREGEAPAREVTERG
jgi:hypothetical protein